MPYSKNKRSIYIWIPKTAGSSLVNGFKRRRVFERDGRAHLWGRIPVELRETLSAGNWQHLSAQSVRDEVGAESWRQCFKFTFVRNPFDRIVSFYEYSKSARKDPSSIQYGQPDPGLFEEWFEREQPLGQLHYVTDPDGELMVDYVGKYENLRSDALHICLKMNITPIRIPHLNKSTRGRYQDYFTPRLRREAESLYADELNFFDYEF